MNIIPARRHCPVQYSMMKFYNDLEKDQPCPFLSYLQKSAEDWILYCNQAQKELHARDHVPDQCIEILPEELIKDMHYEETDKTYSSDEYVKYLENEVYPITILSMPEIYAFIHKNKLY